jgi:histidinol-phosphate phosphatase family protein
MKRQRFVVLDRDGTLIVEHHYLSDPDRVELLPGVAQGLGQLAQLGLGLVVITNQSAVGRGFFDLARLNLIHQRLYALLETEQVRLDGLYFCPHRPEENCPCRKPRPRLLELAGQELGFEPQTCFVIGDQPCDIQLGQCVGATTLLVQTGYGAQVARAGGANPDYTVDGLCAAARAIQETLAEEQRGGAYEARP